MYHLVTYINTYATYYVLKMDITLLEKVTQTVDKTGLLWP